MLEFLVDTNGVTREEKLTYLLLMGWEIYEWTSRGSSTIAEVKEHFLITAHFFTNVDVNDLGTDFLIVMSPHRPKGHRLVYYTVENAYKATPQ